jgi:ribosome-associated heat shock protein Hsp15
VRSAIAATLSRPTNRVRRVKDDPNPERIRLDRWLWAARFFKTRSQAAAAVGGGHVQVDGERAKPARTLRVGSQVTVRRGELVWDVVVRAVAERRGTATEAAHLYEETAQSQAVRARALVERRLHATAGPRSPGRPTKRERRRWERLHRP